MAVEESIYIQIYIDTYIKPEVPRLRILLHKSSLLGFKRKNWFLFTSHPPWSRRLLAVFQDSITVFNKSNIANMFMVNSFQFKAKIQKRLCSSYFILSF